MIHRCTLPRDWIYVRDTAAAIERLAFEPNFQHAIYNVSTGIALACDDIITALRELVPELRTRVLDQEAGNLIARPIASQRLRSDTGWRARHDLKHGLREYISWIRSN